MNTNMQNVMNYYAWVRNAFDSVACAFTCGLRLHI